MSEIVVRKETQTKGFVEFVKKNQYAILASLGIFSAAGLYYLSTIINKNTNNHKQTPQHTTITINKLKPHQTSTPQSTNRQHLTTPQQQSKQIKHTLQRLKSRRQKLLTTSKQFKLEYASQEILTPLLSQQCVLNIFDVCKQLVDEEELNAIYNKNRKARREVFHHTLMNAEIVNDRRESVQMDGNMQIDDYNSHEFSNMDSMQLHISSPRNITAIKNNLKNKRLPIPYPQALSFSQVYYRLVCTFEQDFKYLIQKTQKDFAVFLDIDFSLITQSIDFHISKQENQYFKSKTQQWTSLIKQSLKNKLVRYNEPIHVDRVCNVLKRAIQYLTQKRQLILQMVRKLGISDQQQLQSIPTFIECVLQDEINSRFGVQMEQIFVQMGQMDKNKQLQILGKEFQRLTEGIVHEMYEEVNTEDIHNYQLDDSMECQ